MSGNVETNVRPNPDDVLIKIADYVLDKKIESEEAYNTARYCLMDTLGWVPSAYISRLCKTSWSSC